MHLCASNIGWPASDDAAVFGLMKKYGYSGLEIAPSRVFGEAPYDRQKEAAEWKERLKKQYGFSVPSMQSIWFGRRERLFGTEKERSVLTGYTKKAIDFAAALGCRNLVFGCPVNRNIPQGTDAGDAAAFFWELGEYARRKGTVIGMEANPPVYHTNYITDTDAALELVRNIHSEGFKLNLDTGTMIQNGESAAQLEGSIHLVSHVHISEPGLEPVKERALHKELMHLLVKEGYRGYISVEQKAVRNIRMIGEILGYVRSVFMQETVGFMEQD